MESQKYSREYRLVSISATGDLYDSSTGRINPKIMKDILKNMDEDGKYSINNNTINGVVENILFIEEGSLDGLEIGPSWFIKMGRPLKFKRTIEDTVLEKL
jgi:hypothetical protein